MYTDDDTVWDDLLALIINDFADRELHGIELAGQGKFYPVLLGSKGDWSWLVPWLHFSVGLLIF